MIAAIWRFSYENTTGLAIAGGGPAPLLSRPSTQDKAASMQTLLPLAEEIGAKLKARGETVAVSESSTGGLVSAALLSVPGASAYFLGGAVVYTKKARDVLIDLPADAIVAAGAQKPLSEAFVTLLAGALRDQFSSTWALAEIGATGPAGSRYGDPAGTGCIALAGPGGFSKALTVRTGVLDDRVGNMRAFGRAGLELLLENIQ
jgi:PncC family amidohydrolase